jgi:hypothetical protein
MKFVSLSGGRHFRVLFAAEGQKSQILLAVEAFEKKTQRTPPRLIDLAGIGWTIGAVEPGHGRYGNISRLR